MKHIICVSTRARSDIIHCYNNLHHRNEAKKP